MALRPADFEGLIPLINAFRVTVEYRSPFIGTGTQATSRSRRSASSGASKHAGNRAGGTTCLYH